MKSPRGSVILLGVGAMAMIIFMILKVVNTPIPESVGATDSVAPTQPDSSGPPFGVAPTQPGVGFTPRPALDQLTSTPAPIIRPYADEPTMHTLEQINAARVAQGLWPLKPNLTLNRVAQGQAGYLATLPSLPAADALHRGAEGNDAAQRAAALGWPDYGSPDHIAIVELVAGLPSADQAVDFWQRSPVDSAALSSASYREIGLASVVTLNRAIVVAVLGARPGVLPALIDPAAGALYLTSERSTFANPGAWISEVTRAQIIDQITTGSVHDDAWLAWSPTLPAPVTNAPYSVAYSDDQWLVTTSVDPSVDIAWLPGNEAITAVNPPVVAAPAVEATPTQTVPPPPASPIVNGGLTLVYDYHSLAIINTTGDRFDLRNLALTGETQSFKTLTLPGSLWDTPWLDVAIYHFPAQDCVQVWAWNEGNPGPPAECRFMRAAIYVAPTERFWEVGEFKALWKNQLAATCEASAGRCVVKLP